MQMNNAGRVTAAGCIWRVQVACLAVGGWCLHTSGGGTQCDWRMIGFFSVKKVRIYLVIVIVVKK